MQDETKSTAPIADDWKKQSLGLLFSRRGLVVIAVLAALVAARVGVNLLTRRKEVVALPVVEFVLPALRTLDNGFELPGNLEAVKQASLYSHISGYLKKIHVDEGDMVKKGQLLAEIDAPDAVQEYRKAKAEYDYKEITRKRYTKLLAEQAISQQEYDTVDADASEAQARLENASANLSYTRITAPFSGAIARRYKYPGDLLSASGKSGSESPIFLLVDETELRVAINVPQSETAHIKIGDQADIHIDSLPNTPLKGTISRLDALLDSSTKTQRVLIDLPNPNLKIHAGMFASVQLRTARLENALTLPKEAIHQKADGTSFVYLVKDGALQQGVVTPGAHDDKFTQIVNGVSATDQVIVGGAGALTEGQRVSAVPAKASHG